MGRKMQVELIDLVGVPIGVLYLLIVLYIRNRDLRNATNILERETKSIWYSVFPSLNIESTSIQSKMTTTSESYNNFYANCEKNFLDSFTKTIILKSYLPILALSSIFSLGLSSLVPSEIVLRIVWIESAFITVLLLSITDLVATYTPKVDKTKLRRVLCGYGDTPLLVLFVLLMAGIHTIIATFISAAIFQLGTDLV